MERIIVLYALWFIGSFCCRETLKGEEAVEIVPAIGNKDKKSIKPIKASSINPIKMKNI